MSRSVIPINENYYLLLTMDFEENNIDKIITEKIIPLIKKKRNSKLKLNFISYLFVIFTVFENYIVTATTNMIYLY